MVIYLELSPFLERKKVEVFEEVKLLIIKLRSEGYSDYKIAPIVNLNRSKVQRYRKEQGID